jgi:3-oxoacyl-[acyl-carrier-protein] synthase II
MMQSLPDVYVRGVGAITALGSNWRQSLSALATGDSAIATISNFDATDFPCTVAAAIPASLFQTKANRRLELAVQAAHEAWIQAALADTASERIGIFIGSEAGRPPFSTVLNLTQAAGGGAQFDHAQFALKARPFVSHLDAANTSPAAVASLLAELFQARGPVVTISLACASSAAAISEATRAIRLGECDVAVCGGVGADVDPLMLAGFGKLGALSARGISCPFDVQRDGFVVGEGAAMVVLANTRGNAQVAIVGEGRSLDAYHLTSPDPEGNGAIRAMRSALQQAQSLSNLQKIDYVQAHGTSTPLNDAVEAKALQKIFGAKLDNSHVSSVKGALGHWIAGAGALGFLCAHSAIADGIILPTANLQQVDSVCALPHVIGNAIKQHCDSAMVNAFAFGGANCCLVLQRCSA